MNGLGSSTDYNRLRFQYGGNNIRHLVERVENSLLEKARSELWQALKEAMLSDGTVEEANRFLTKEVLEFQAKYPRLVRSRKVAGQLVENVLAVLSFRHPALGECVTVSRQAEHSGSLKEGQRPTKSKSSTLSAIAS